MGCLELVFKLGPQLEAEASTKVGFQQHLLSFGRSRILYSMSAFYCIAAWLCC